MPDYSKGKIYTIRSYQTDKIYIGSTTQRLSERFHSHKKDYKKYLEGKKSNSSSYILQYEDAYIELLKNYPCTSKEELLKAEGEEIRKHDCVNKVIAGRTQKEYYDENAQKIKDKVKQWYEENKDKRKEYRKQYKELYPDKLKEQRKKSYEKRKNI